MSPQSQTGRRAFLIGAAGVLLSAGSTLAADTRAIAVFRSPSCGCCGKWVDALRRAGLKPTVTLTDDLGAIRRGMSVPDSLASCHTAKIQGYVIEGHVPPADILRLVAERPKALGLVLPGMPMGSPGMETPGVAAEPFTTLLLLNARGQTRTFARHG